MSFERCGGVLRRIGWSIGVILWVSGCGPQATEIAPKPQAPDITGPFSASSTAIATPPLNQVMQVILSPELLSGFHSTQSSWERFSVITQAHAFNLPRLLVSFLNDQGVVEQSSLDSFSSSQIQVQLEGNILTVYWMSDLGVIAFEFLTPELESVSVLAVSDDVVDLNEIDQQDLSSLVADSGELLVEALIGSESNKKYPGYVLVQAAKHILKKLQKDQKLTPILNKFPKGKIPKHAGKLVVDTLISSNESSDNGDITVDIDGELLTFSLESENSCDNEEFQPFSAIIGNSFIGECLFVLDPLTPVYDFDDNTTTYIFSLQCADYTTNKDISHTSIELGSCHTVVPGSASRSDLPNPTVEIGTDPSTGITGIKFDDEQDKTTDVTYSFTVEGIWALTWGEVGIKAGSGSLSTALITAPVLSCTPCEDTESELFKISGVVYVDVNLNGIYDVGEPLLNDVRVLLDNTASDVTDSNGYYEFTGLSAGTYTVAVDMNPSAPGFNQSLIAYFSPVNPNPPSAQVTVGPDATQDFGFTLNPGSVDIEGEGKTIGFWKHQLSVILTGKGKAQVPQSILDGLLAQIAAFYLPSPFSFGSPGYADAFAVLSSTSSDAVDLLLKQLLASEFNYFYGIGLSDSALMVVILQIAESYVLFQSSLTREQILALKDLLDAINNSGE